MFPVKQVLHRFFAVVFLLVLTAGFAHADEPIVLPAGGADVLTFDENSAIKFRKSNVKATAEWMPAQDMPFKNLYRVKSDTRYSKQTNAQVIVPITGSFKKGDTILFSFWVRRPQAGGQPNNATFRFRTAPDKKIFEYKLSAYREWKQHVRSFVAAEDTTQDKSSIQVLLGEAGQIAEIADFRLINYGPDYDIKTLPRSTVDYKGRAPDAQWRKDALARIEKIRKGDINIEVVDADGKPVAGAAVRVQMQKHAFGFGNAVNAYLVGAPESDFPYTKVRSGKKFTSSWQDAQQYREVLKNHFSSVTFESELRPHVWIKQMKGVRDGQRLREVMADHAVPWLQKNDIDIRGHYLAWAPMDFNAIEKEFVGDPAGHRKWLWNHMADVLPKTNSYVTEWDTINHIIGWGKHTYEKEYGSPEIYAQIMQEARRLAPDATHAINEGKILPDGYKRKPYKRIVEYLNEQGQPADVVGFMAHFGLTSLTPPEELLDVYDDFAEVAPRLQLSELDVDAGDDEQLQADYLRDVMIASFSHPKFVSIIQWGFWEGAHWKPAAALWRSDWSLKPSGQVFVDLVTKQWWTDETLTTDAAGICATRGFLGDYKVFVEFEGRTEKVEFAVKRTGAEVQIQLN
jgi:GH35 family endo-1,4-beta-xylanase